MGVHGKVKVVDGDKLITECRKCEHYTEMPSDKLVCGHPKADDGGEDIITKANSKGGFPDKCPLIQASTQKALASQNGIFIEPHQGDPLYITDYINGTIVASLFLNAVFVRPKTIKPYCVLEIHNMWTRPKNRKEGRMKKLVNVAKTLFNGNVRYIVSSWKQSSPEGRALLLGCGFIEKKGAILWQNHGLKLDLDDIEQKDPGFLQKMFSDLKGAIEREVKG